MADLDENIIRRSLPFGVDTSIAAVETHASENLILHDSEICDYPDRLLGSLQKRKPRLGGAGLPGMGFEAWGTSQICPTRRKEVQTKNTGGGAGRGDEMGLACRATFSRTLRSSARTHAIGVEGVSEEHADAEEREERRHDLGHGRPPIAAVPMRAALRNCR